jgi:hypothetical protein
VRATSYREPLVNDDAPRDEVKRRVSSTPCRKGEATFACNCTSYVEK